MCVHVLAPGGVCKDGLLLCGFVGSVMCGGAVSVRLEAMMRPVSRDRTQVLMTNQNEQTRICHSEPLAWACCCVLELASVCGSYACTLCGATDLDLPDVDSETKLCRSVHGKH